MLEVKTRLVAPALMALAAVALAGCSASQDGPKYPPKATEAAIAKFNTATGDLPYPSDPFFFLGSTDGTINLPVISYRGAAVRDALNALDGWSTSATLATGFTLPLDPATINAASVRIVKVYLNPTNKAPVDVTDPVQVASYLPTGWPLAQGPIAGVLTFGTDFTASVDDSIDSNGKYLKITPLKPFDFSKGPAVTGGKVFNIGYIVILTNGLKSTDGQTFTSDTMYAGFKAAPTPPSAACKDPAADTATKLVCFTKPQLAIAQAVGVDPANVILSWSFSTQSVDDTFAYIAATATAKQTLIVPAFNAALGRILTTHDANASLQGKADIYAGSTVLPYYLTATNGNDSLAVQKAAVNTKFWTAAGPSPVPGIDATSRNLTMFNWAPAKTADVTVPILVTVPRIGAGAGFSACPGMPPGGWPVAIVQHGITGNRSLALAMADGFADQCFIVVSMDLPLHGITATSATDPLTGFHCFAPPATPNPACLGAVERTFDVDFAAPAGPDSSGAYFINLSSPLTGRDNLRQAEADLIQLTKSLAAAAPLGLTVAQAAPGSLPAGSVGVDPTRISFVGLSLGSIVGGTHAHFSNDTRTVALSVPGGVITKLLLDSQAFGPSITAGVGANYTPGSFLFNLFFRDFQAIIDSGDPINHIKDAQNMHPTLLFKVLNDTVVPNNSTDRLILAGNLHKLTTPGANAVGPGTGAWSFFKAGWHGTLFGPCSTTPTTPPCDPAAHLLETMEMQAQAISFSASAPLPGGPYVQVGVFSTDVLDLTPP